MTSSTTTWLTRRWKVVVAAGLGLAAFLALFAFVAHTPGKAGAAPASAAAMLAVITAGAVGIERALEVFWTLAGQLAHGWWPFNRVFHQVEALEADLNGCVDALHAELERQLANAANLSADAQAKLALAQDEMAKLQARLAELGQLAPGNQQINLIAASVLQGIGMIQQIGPQLDFNFRLVDQAVAGLTDFVASFKDNPARRLVSIWAGALIGLFIAYLVRLDVFLAVLGDDLTPAGWWLHLEVALTGLIIGLGSNPTHEVIEALKQIKQYRTALNQPSPLLIESSAGMTAALPSEFAIDRPAATPPPPPIRRFR